MKTAIDTTHHTLERPGCTLHYWLSGPADRPLIVMTHGATMDHGMFDAQIDALVPEYRVLTWDMRGHGRSRPVRAPFMPQDCADDLLALLDAVGTEQAVLLGQSMGGYVTQYAYARAPQRVRAMVIIGSTSIAVGYKAWEINALKFTLPLFKVWPYARLKKTVAHGNSIKPEVRAYIARTVEALDREAFLTIWKATTLAINTTGLPGHQIRVPLLLTHGAHDRAGTIRRDAPTWAKSEPDVEYSVIPDAGHNANQDNAAFFNRVLLEFLRTRVSA